MQLTCSSRGRWHNAAEVLALRLPDSFVVGEEKGAIFPYRPARGATKLNAVERRDSRPIEEISCVEYLVAVKDVGASMGGIGA